MIKIISKSPKRYQLKDYALFYDRLCQEMRILLSFVYLWDLEDIFSDNNYCLVRCT